MKALKTGDYLKAGSIIRSHKGTLIMLLENVSVYTSKQLETAIFEIHEGKSINLSPVTIFQNYDKGVIKFDASFFERFL
jgi:hypothetical protein